MHKILPIILTWAVLHSHYGQTANSRDAPYGFTRPDSILTTNSRQPAVGPGLGLSLFGPSLTSSLSSTSPGQLSPQNRTPYVLGDGTMGGCGSVSFAPGSFVNIEHPTFNCIRANIAENNSAVPRDRAYVRYNHFHNITETNIFGNFRPDGVANLHIDRFVLGLEQTFADGRFSLEYRVPFAAELSSDIFLARTPSVPGTPVTGVVADTLPLDSTAWELGNFSFLGKFLVHQSPEWAVSMGAALNVPTADDVDIAIVVDDPAFPVQIAPDVTVLVVPVQLDITASVKNETFNLSPFAAFLWTPSDNWFFQGFIQFDFPLNESNATGQGSGSVAGVPLDLFNTNIEGVEKLLQQALLRISLGGGRWIVEDLPSPLLGGLAAILEMHYTTTLQDARLVEFDVPIIIPGMDADVAIGNLANRVDILNLTAGVSAEVGAKGLLTLGAVAPLRVGTDKPFDAEIQVHYNQRY